MENVRMSLLEAYSNALNRVAKSAAGRRAVAEWEPLVTTRSGELACIDAAKAGEESAKLYLFIRSIPQLGSALKKFLGPDTRAAYSRVQGGEDQEFVSEALMALDAALTGKKTIIDAKGNEIQIKAAEYDPSKAAKDKSPINDLGMWLRFAMMSVGSNINRATNRGFMKGKVSKTDAPVHVGSYEAHIEAGGEDVESKHEIGTRTAALDAWETFVDDDELDSGKDPTLRQILKFFLAREDFDVNAASEKFGKTNMTIRTKLTTIKPVLEKHGISYEDFGMLIRDHGADLAQTL